MRPTIIVSLLAFASAFAAPMAYASGTAGGGFGGGYGGGYGGGPSQSAPRDPVDRTYARGQSMLEKRVACKKCAFPGGVLDKWAAQRAAQRIRGGEFALNPKEREQVLYYLSRRFGA